MIGNYLINGKRFDGPQYHWMSCSIYRDSKDNHPGSGGYRCDCNFIEHASAALEQVCKDITGYWQSVK